MSDTGEVIDDKKAESDKDEEKVAMIDAKSEDKLEIEDEERERVNEDDKKDEVRVGGGEVEKKKKALEEAALQGSKRRVPIGGIKIPGFLRSSRSRDKNKEGEAEGEEGTDLLEAPCNVVNISEEKENKDEQPISSRLPVIGKIKFSNPFAKRRKETITDPEKPPDGDEPEEGEVRKPKLINAIKLPLPLQSMLPKKLNPTKEPDLESGPPAGLASMETLDDKNDSNKDDGMEQVKLDNDMDPEKAALEEENESKWARSEWRQHIEFVIEHKVAFIGLGIFFFLLFILILIIIFGGRPPTAAPIIDGKYVTAVTSCGPVEGVLEDRGFVFRGIPYAQPPVGDLRWARPEPLGLRDCWNGTLKAHNATPSCWQIYSNGSMDGSEDCLTLDIYTPQVRYDSPLPVIVLIGADSFLGGSPGKLQPAAILSNLKDVVFVRPNFRLSVLGFLAAYPLTQAAYPPSSGNYGLQDVIAALEWTKLNIVHFGGDERSITVFGYRAGATIATALTSLRKPHKLFSRVWLSSGSSVFTNKTLIDSMKESEEYLKATPCATNMTLECLRELDVEELLDAIPDSWREMKPIGLPVRDEVKPHQWIVLDGVYIKENPYDIWRRVNFTIQVVVGTSKHAESTKLERSNKDDWNEKEYKSIFENGPIGMDGIMKEVIDLYNMTLEGLESAISDIRTLCPLYYMTRSMPNSWFYYSSLEREDGVADKGADVDAILGRYTAPTTQHRRHVSAIQHMFYQFVTLGIPPNSRVVQVDQDPLPVKDLPKCRFWHENGFGVYARAN